MQRNALGRLGVAADVLSCPGHWIGRGIFFEKLPEIHISWTRCSQNYLDPKIQYYFPTYHLIMNTITNLHYLNDYLADTRDLKQGANLYKRQANISFKIQKADHVVIIVEVRQGRNSQNKYLSTKELIVRTKDLFSRFFPEHTIHTRPKPYHAPPPDVVTPQWIQDQMQQSEINLKQLERETGIDRVLLSDWINDKHPLEQVVKAMFYYYFTHIGD